MNGTLYIIATPIGNVEDITLRALRTLQEVDGIAAEDTRHTGQLLSRLAIKRPLMSLHEHNELQRVQILLEKLQRGESWALVSDAGTPGICDPGAKLVRALVQAGIRCVPIPGPCAMVTALSASGIATSQFYFEGFLPQKQGERKRRLQHLQPYDCPIVFYEAPHRLHKTLDDLCQVFGDAPLIVARELTKVYEQIVHTTLFKAKEQFDTPRVEFVLIVQPPPREAQQVDWQAVAEALSQRMAQGVPRKEAAAEIANAFGVRKNEVYRLDL